MEKNKLIVFDIDGTLTDTVLMHQRAFTNSLKKIGVIEIDSNYNEYLHHTDSYIAKVIYEMDRNEVFTQKHIKQFENHLMRELTHEQINEIKGAKAVITKLESNSNYAVCYATGALLKTALHKLNEINVPFNENLLVASNNIHERERIVEKAIEQAKLFYKTDAFDQIISVGDGLWDLKTADNLKVDFIGIGEKNRTILIENGAKLVLKDLSSFLSELKITDN